MAFVGILSRIKLLFGPLVIQLVWYILKQFTVINASAAVTLLEQRPEKNQALSGIRTHDLCDASAVLYQLSYQSHMRAVVCGLALLIWDVILGPSIVG